MVISFGAHSDKAYTSAYGAPFITSIVFVAWRVYRRVADRELGLRVNGCGSLQAVCLLSSLSSIISFFPFAANVHSSIATLVPSVLLVAPRSWTGILDEQGWTWVAASRRTRCDPDSFCVSLFIPCLRLISDVSIVFPLALVSRGGGPSEPQIFNSLANALFTENFISICVNATYVLAGYGHGAAWL